MDHPWIPHHKRFWTSEEDKALIRTLASGGKWLDAAAALQTRSNVNCKDRYRTLKNKYGSDAAVFAAFDYDLTDNFYEVEDSQESFTDE